MDLSRQEYPALLTSLQPDQAIFVLEDRVASINKVNTDIADYLLERRRIEERYAADLRRLSRRPHAESSTSLGIFDLPWQRIVASTEALAQSHETLASKIETDVENPLKQYGTKNREMQSITTIQGNLASIAKDLSRAREKADKLNARGGRKADNATLNADDASREWESQSPYVFEQLQALDENRVNHLRDVLTQLQTHELDQLEKARASAEACLNALLNVETADEIKTFAAKITQMRGIPIRRGSSATAADRPRSSIGNVPPAPPPPRHSDSRHNSALNPDRLAPVLESTPDKKSSKIGGLKRLGTVMRGKKGAAPPPPQGASEKKKDKSRGFVPFRRGDSSRSFQDLEESGQDLPPPPTLQPDRTGSSHDHIAAEQRNLQSQGSGHVGPAELNGITTPPPKSPTNEVPAPLMPMTAATTQQPPEQTGFPAALPQMQFSSPETGFTVPGIEPPPGQNLEEPSRNLTIRDAPIQEDANEAKLAMNNLQSQLRLQAPTLGMNRPQGSIRGRRDVRNTIFVQSGNEVSGTGFGSTDAATSLAPSAILASAPALAPAPAPAPAQVPAPAPMPVAVSNIPQPSTPNLANPADISGQSLTTASPIYSPSATRTSIPVLSEDQTTGSDANSIHSSQTLNTVVMHPELIRPGLNASIVETVSTWFNESGVTKSLVVGEVAFSHIASSAVTPQETEVIRLRNFQVLEKVAANPTFVTRSKPDGMSLEEQAGSYNIALSAIRRSFPTVGLKYQLHLSQTDLSVYSPILVTPAWQILDGQASVIVLYGLNPSFMLPHAAAVRELTIKNVAISVSLDIKETGSGKATSAMMAPNQGASFRRKTSSVVWRFSELKVKAGQERLLVRFITEGGMPKKGSIELNFEATEVTAGGLGVEKMRTVTSATHAESDPFADEEEARKSGEGAIAVGGGTGTWEEIPTARKLISGKYSAT